MVKACKDRTKENLVLFLPELSLQQKDTGPLLDQVTDKVFT